MWPWLEAFPNPQIRDFFSLILSSPVWSCVFWNLLLPWWLLFSLKFRRRLVRGGWQALFILLLSLISFCLHWELFQKRKWINKVSFIIFLFLMVGIIRLMPVFLLCPIHPMNRLCQRSGLLALEQCLQNWTSNMHSICFLFGRVLLIILICLFSVWWLFLFWLLHSYGVLTVFFFHSIVFY